MTNQTNLRCLRTGTDDAADFMRERLLEAAQHSAADLKDAVLILPCREEIVHSNHNPLLEIGAVSKANYLLNKWSEERG